MTEKLQTFWSKYGLDIIFDQPVSLWRSDRETFVLLLFCNCRAQRGAFPNKSTAQRGISRVQLFPPRVITRVIVVVPLQLQCC